MKTKGKGDKSVKTYKSRGERVKELKAKFDKETKGMTPEQKKKYAKKFREKESKEVRYEKPSNPEKYKKSVGGKDMASNAAKKYDNYRKSRINKLKG